MENAHYSSSETSRGGYPDFEIIYKTLTYLGIGIPKMINWFLQVIVSTKLLSSYAEQEFSDLHRCNFL